MKFSRQGVDNACCHQKACGDKENTRFVSCDIKFTRKPL